MAGDNVLAGEPIRLYAQAKGLRYDKVHVITFVLERSDKKAPPQNCNANIKRHLRKANEYSGEIVAAEPLPDELHYEATCHLVVPKSNERRLVSTVTVWRRTLTVKAVEAAKSTPAVSARCQVRLGSDTETLITDEHGSAEIDLEFREVGRIEWHEPWSLKQWVRRTGPLREAELAYDFEARIVRRAEDEQERRQWVLRDPKLGEDCGPKVTLELCGHSGLGRPGDKVYFKAWPPGLPVVEKELTLDDKAGAATDLDIGTSVDEETVVKVGSSPACKDDELKLRPSHHRAKLEYPSKPLHLQHIRREPTQGHDCGRELEVVVRIGRDDGGRLGDKVYLRRTDPKKAVSLLDAELDPSHRATFKLDLGDEPGAVNLIEVGSTEECKDGKTEVRNVVYQAKLAYPPSGAVDHKQWVNLDSDPKAPHQGHVVRVRVVSATPKDEQAIPDGQPVYIRAIFGDQNSKRSADQGGANQGVRLAAEAKFQKGEATAKVNVGHAGGDKVAFEVSFHESAVDDRASIVTWRQLYYELCYPDTMALEGADLPDATRAFAMRELATAFIEYAKVGASTYVPEGKLRLQAGYLKRGGSETLVVLGEGDRPGSFQYGDPRCISVLLCDGYFGHEGQVTLRKKATTREVELDVGKLHSGLSLPRHMGRDSSALEEGTWQAKLSPTSDPAHPGWQSADVPKSGAIDEAWVTWVDVDTVKVVFPPDSTPGKLVGNLTDTTCPLELAVTMHTALELNGSAAEGTQILVHKPGAPLSMAATCLHELGHSMGQTVMGTGSSHPKKPTPGVKPPLWVVPGTAYDGHGHVGTHCAHGVGKHDKEKSEYTGLKADNGGDCIMWGAGSSEDPPRRGRYCDDCLTQIKARKLQDVCSSWETRADDLV